MSTQKWSRQIAEWADEWNADLVRYLARRTVSRADAQDLAQEVYLRLLRVDRQDLIRQPRRYMLRIAANLLSEWRLKARQALPHEADEPASLEAPDDPELSALAVQRSQRLLAEFDQLRPPVRAALALQLREGMSYEQIAAELKVTPRMVKRYLVTAYAVLRERVPSDL